MHNPNSLAKNPIFRASVLSFLMLALLIVPEKAAFALNLCDTIKSLFYDKNLGKGIATMGVLAIGIAATFGRVTWATAVMTVVGIAVIFTAGSLATSAGGGCPDPTP
jgi:type IV secretory pathway VirB2 component (pilin)